MDLIYPRVDADARTTRVRFSVKNTDMALRPGQYGWVELSHPARTVVAVPRDALIDTGLERYVFVQESPGRFVPGRSRSAPSSAPTGFSLYGRRAAGRTGGLGGDVLLDSESRLKASLGGKGAAASQDYSKHGSP